MARALRTSAVAVASSADNPPSGTTAQRTSMSVETRYTFGAALFMVVIAAVYLLIASR